MYIIDEKLDLDIRDTLTHKRFPFNLERTYDKLIIKLSYSPALVPDDEKREILEEAIEKYLPLGEYSQREREDTLNARIENFLTTALFYEGKFIGAWHNKSTDQEIIVSKYFASKGYHKAAITPGSYELVLSMHSANSKITGKLSLEVIDE